MADMKFSVEDKRSKRGLAIAAIVTAVLAFMLAAYTDSHEIHLRQDVNFLRVKLDETNIHLSDSSSGWFGLANRISALEEKGGKAGPTQVMLSPADEKRIAHLAAMQKAFDDEHVALAKEIVSLRDRLNKIEPTVGCTELDHLSKSFSDLREWIAGRFDEFARNIAGLEDRIEQLEKRKCRCPCCHPKGER
jgi:predicted  nucleic acid-binding Zn-ribbon protein